MIAEGRLVCCAMPFGYGPPAKLLAIAQRLAARGVRLDFVGRGIAHELVSRSAVAFESILCCRADDPRASEVIRASTGMLSVMDREFAPLAIRCGVPLHVVDSLLWMRPEIPPAFRRATAYWAQRFAALDEFAGDFDPRPTIVGPILTAAAPRRNAAVGETIVNLGGCESSEDRRVEQSYAEFVVRGLIRSGQEARFEHRVVVASGARCAARLRAGFAGCGIEFVSLAHDEALERFQAAAVVLTSPGLTATLECFQRGIPTCFLPPQNYSQWCILRHLRREGLAPHSMHWEDTQPVRLGERLPEAQRQALVERSIVEGTADDRTADILHRCLVAARRDDSGRAELAARQRRFFRSLGPDGAEAIADALGSTAAWHRTDEPHVPAETRTPNLRSADSRRLRHGTR